MDLDEIIREQGIKKLVIEYDDTEPTHKWSWTANEGTTMRNASSRIMMMWLNRFRGSAADVNAE